MAAMVVAVLGLGQAALRRANRELEDARRRAGPRQCRAQDPGPRAQQGRGPAAPGAQDAGARPAHRRHRARFQQPPDRNPGLGRHAAPPRHRGGQAHPLRRGSGAGLRQGGRSDRPAARLRPAPAAPARGDRRQRADRGHDRPDRPHSGRADQGVDRARGRCLQGRGRPRPARIRPAQHRRQRPRRNAGRRHPLDPHRAAPGPGAAAR